MNVAQLLLDIGPVALQLGLVTAIVGAVMGALGATSRSENVLSVAVRAVRATAVLSGLACIALWAGFLTNRFDVEYVASYSSRALPTAYKVAALWGGQKGSLLLWAALLGLYAAVVVRRRGEPHLMAGVASVLMAVMTFFLVLANFSTNPFEKLPPDVVPPDGQGLNPLLQHPAMAIHPPLLYLGFVGMAVPFAYMVAALLLRRRDDRWIRMSRKATLVAWVALFAGNMLGMAWAYMELGWGGYWAWDPVENAAVMPLLTGTAFLHSVMIQERRGMLKVWNAFLVAITFLLTIFGTFLTRSGVVSSVHSFGASTLGTYFLVFLTVCCAFTAYVLFARRDLLKSEHRLDSLWSREAAFIVNNIVLVGAAFSILWGTTYPIVSEAVAGVKATVGAPFFNQVNIPIAVLLLLLTGVGPLIAWRRASLEQIRKMFLVPAILGAATVAALLAFGVRGTYALLVFGLVTFVAATIVDEFIRGARARRAKHGEPLLVAMLSLTMRNPRRYGGYVVHVGVLLFFLGVAASSAYKSEHEALITVGQEMPAGPYRIRMDAVRPVEIPRASGIAVDVTALRGEREVAKLTAEKLVYRTGIRQEEQPTTNVGIRSTLRDDLYIIPAAWFPETGKMHLRVFVNPGVSWIWIGGAFVLLGVGIALVPAGRLKTAEEGGAARGPRRPRGAPAVTPVTVS